MSLHVQMSETAVQNMRRASILNKLSAFFAALLLLSLGGGILYMTAILIRMEQAPAFETYVAPAENAPPTKKPQVKELTTKQTSTTSQVAPSVMIANSSADIAMADIELESIDIGTGASVDLGLGFSNDLGSGLGEGGGGLGSSDTGGSCLEGTMYDFKLTRTGARSEVGYDPERKGVSSEGATQVGLILGNFLTSSWNPKILEKYYRSKTKLYASHVFIPMCDANIAPKAFKAEDKIEPSGWCIVYRGKVRAPKTGRFCFLGWGDDGVAVRFNRKMVFEGGQYIGSFFKNVDNVPLPMGLNFMGNTPTYQDNVGSYHGHEGYQFYDTMDGRKCGGNIIEVEEGKVYPIEIMITEIPGGSFRAYVLIADLDAPRTEDGKLVLDLFRTNFSFPEGSNFRSYSEDSLIWAVVP